jgi:hypothetical protein
MVSPKQRGDCGAPGSWIALIAAAWILVAVSPSSAAAARLVFVENEPLQTTCASLRNGIEIRIRNETAATQSLNVVPVEFRDPAGTEVQPEEVCGGLEVDGPSTLPGGRATTAEIKGKDKTAQGDLSGTLLLYPDRGKVSRREIAISPPNPHVDPQRELAAAPLVTAQTIHLDDSSQGPILIPVKGPAKDLPPSKTNEDGEPKPTVGAVAGSNGEAAIAYGGAERLNGESAKASLSLEPDGLPPGAYKGTVDLNQGDDEKGTVELEIKVSKSWILAAILLAIGILIALPLQRLFGRWLPRVRLRGRIRELETRHNRARVKLAQMAKASGEAEWGSFSIADLKALEERLEEQLTAGTRLAVIQIDKKVQESLEAAIAVVESQIDLLKEIPRHARYLEKALREVNPGPRPNSSPSAKPVLYGESTTALRGREIDAEQLNSLIEEIDARTKQIHILHGLMGRLDSLTEERGKLNIPRNEKTKLKELEKHLAVIRYLLWTARTAEDLDTAAKAIQGAANEIAELGVMLPGEEPREAMRYALVGDRRFAPFVSFDPEWRPPSDEAAAIEAVEVPAGAPSAPPPPPSVPEAPPAPKLNAGAAEREARHALMAQFAAVGIGILVALASGLIALYVPNETWGSTWDLVAAVVWGLGAQASVSSLATAIDGFGAFGLLRRS